MRSDTFCYNEDTICIHSRTTSKCPSGAAANDDFCGHKPMLRNDEFPCRAKKIRNFENVEKTFNTLMISAHLFMMRISKEHFRDSVNAIMYT